MNDNKALVGCGILLIGLLCLGCCGGCVAVSENTYSTGHRDGYVQKFSYKGIIWKNYEGEMALAGFHRKGEDGISNTWQFNAHDPEIIKQLEALHDDDHVRLYYRQVWAAMPWNGGTDYRIIKIENLKNKKEE